MQQIDIFGTSRGAAGIPPTMINASARALALTRPCWVPYPVGSKAVDMLGRLMDAPSSHRPHCLLIHADTNMGKTVIGRRFANQRNRPKPDAGERLVRQVVHVDSPPMADFGALIGFILRKLDAPVPTTISLSRRIDQLLSVIATAGVRMLIIDEIHNILVGRPDQRGIFLNGLKYLSNELQIPIVLIGNITAVRAIQTDQQLGNRFEPFHLPRWQANGEYACFLAGLCKAVEIDDTKAFQSGKFVTRFHMMSEGLTGETWDLMCRAAEVAILSGREVIDDETLDQVTWVRPSDRRKG